MVGEFLIWTQVVRYWTVDAKMDLATATNLYIFIGMAGIITMPVMGKVADMLVGKFGDEIKARKTMLVFAPASACALASCCWPAAQVPSPSVGSLHPVRHLLAIEPGGCAGYAGAVYGRKSLGRIWGLQPWSSWRSARRWALRWLSSRRQGKLHPISLVCLGRFRYLHRGGFLPASRNHRSGKGRATVAEASKA